MTVIITAKLQLPSIEVASTLFWLHNLQYQASDGNDPYTCKRWNIKSYIVGTDGQTDRADCITFLVKAVCNQHCT